MKKFLCLFLVASFLVISGGCRHEMQSIQMDTLDKGAAPIIATVLHDTITVVHTSEMRIPDVTIRVRKGSALYIETEGLQLSALDTAVRHTGSYSVTSLMATELPSLPQGMMNMTAAAAGYRLLPSGEHFRPYAELRVAYNPDILPKGYSPDDIYTSFYDTSSLAWVRLERIGVDTVNHEIISRTTHFTDFVNELLKAPEMPETQAFVPTAMSDLEAVNPLDRLPIIQPPTANNNGTANISYSFDIPTGRGGMQPNLALTYNSAGGSGWLGVGWDISVSSISLDTRWGVPRYNGTYETEIYMLDGEQLITLEDDGTPRQMPHRTNKRTPRLPDSTQFYARTGDAHDSIIRHGNTPSDYWWEVIDRNGVTNYYGYYVDSSRRSLAVTLCDDNNNIARWPLTESRDLHGNAVRYYYGIDTVTAYGNEGRQLYLDSITYTGHLDTDGVYTLVFHRRDNVKTDIPVVCNNGFKEITDKLLCNVSLKYLNTVVSAWFFSMENSLQSNYKNRLTAISKVDSTIKSLSDAINDFCQLSYSMDDYADYAGVTTRFDYYDAPSYDTLFGPAITSIIPVDNIRGFFSALPSTPFSTDKATAMGLSHSASWNVGGAITAGTGVKVWNSDLSIGGNYQHSASASEALLSLVDLDGDGLADKVFVRDGEMSFRRQLPSNEGHIRFSDTAFHIDGASSFLQESSKSNTWGAQASMGVGGNASWTNTTSETSVYFSDVNGDGLVDLIDNGQVLFNSLIDGVPTFTLYDPFQHISGDGTESEPVILSDSSCGGIIFDGEVNDSITCRRIWTRDSIYIPKIEEYTTTVNALIGAGYRIDSILCMGNAGAKLYTSLAEWDCSYHESVPNTEAVRVWIAPDSGEIMLTSLVSLLEDTSDDRKIVRHVDGITYTIQHSSGIQYGDSLSNANGYNNILLSEDICDTCYQTIEYEDSFTVNKGDMIFFRLRSKNNHQFDNIIDSHNIQYTDIGRADVTYNSHDDFVLSGNNCFQAPVSGNLSLHANYNSNGDTRLVVALGDTFFVYSQDTLFHLDEEGTVCLSVQAIDSINPPDWGEVSCRPYLVFTPDTTQTVIIHGDTATIGNGNSFSTYLAAHMEINHGSDSIYVLPLCQKLFGPLYHGWGQFAYHSLDTGGRADTLRIEMLKKPDTSIATSTSSQIDTNRFKNATSLEEFQRGGDFFNPLSYSSYWVEMTPDIEHDVWISYGLQNSVGRDTVSNSLHKEWYTSAPDVPDTIFYSQPNATFHDDAVPVIANGAPTKAIIKTTSASSRSYSLSAANVGLSYSKGKNHLETDYMDLNGDRYPDIVGPDMVQYSQPWGGIGPMQVLGISAGEKNLSSTHSVGASFSASPITVDRGISISPANAKFVIDSKGNGPSSGGGNVGWDDAAGIWMDINGDGLSDFVTDDGMVQLNIGYGFLEEENFNQTDLRSGVSGAISESFDNNPEELAFSRWQGSIKAGRALNTSYNRTTSMLIDINGDGLPDRVYRKLTKLVHLLDSSIITTQVQLNQGNGNWSSPIPLDIGHFSSSVSYNENLDLGFTAGFTFLGLKITAGVNGSPFGGGVSRDNTQLVDINADGLPDLVSSWYEGIITVRYNKGGRTNLLHTVTNFTGARFHLGYTLSEPSRNQPSRSWLMTTVTTGDPLNPVGGDTTVTNYAYSEPCYDRYERTSYGYGTVITSQVNPVSGNPYRKIQRKYYNSNMLRRGRLKEELTYVDDNTFYIKKEFSCIYKDEDDVAFRPDTSCSVLHAFNSSERISTTYYEGDTIPLLKTTEFFEYDRYHNVLHYTDYGSDDNQDDGIEVTFHYYTGLNHNLIALRKDYTVTPFSSPTILRQTHFDYDTMYGKLIRQTLLNGADSSMFEFVYDPVYGNLVSGIQPPNHIGQRLAFTYLYDGIVHTYPAEIHNSYGESVHTTYDYVLGKPRSVTDPTGSTMTYRYDFAGRLISANSPLNTSGTPSLINQYHPINYYHGDFQPQGYTFEESPSGHPYSVSEHYDDNGSLITETVVITDGFGRVIQTKKGLQVNGVDMMQVSGRVVSDPFGRTTEQYDPVVEDSYFPRGLYNGNYDPASRTQTNYDVLDRVTSVEQPLNTVTKTDYSIENDPNGFRRFVTAVTDPNGNQTLQYSDYEGRQVQLNDANGGITSFQYDAVGQLLESKDPEGFYTYYNYDRLGRLVSRDHPDAGFTNYSYDPAGNLIEEMNSLGFINYSYLYRRPIQKNHSDISYNDVTYTYDNAGRVNHVTDGSGQRVLLYDELGNISEETCTLAIPGDNYVYQFTMKYEYDSWGRLTEMKYPDDEVVKYSYQWGGDLSTVTGEKNHQLYEYIKSIKYNGLGQRKSIQYGNGTSAEYKYDTLHRLSRLICRDGYGVPIQDIDYSFDPSSNIVGMSDNGTSVNGIGGGYTREHNYDALNRLLNSYGMGAAGSYTTSLDYTASGRLLSITDAINGMNTERWYGYCDDYIPHAPRRIGFFADYTGMIYDLRWDDVGNLRQITSFDYNTDEYDARFHYWTEDNRLHTVADQRHYSYYAYDHDGNRTLKLTGESDLMDINADEMSTTTVLTNVTLYPSPFIVLTNRGYTKHYYVGEERLAARIGCGGLHHTSENQDMSYMADLLFMQCHEKVIDDLPIPNDENCIMVPGEKEIKLMEIDINRIPQRLNALTGIDITAFNDAMISIEGDCDWQQGGVSFSWPGINQGQNTWEENEEVFFYHSDHLGSASWITDHNGDAIQHLQYMPFGAPFVDQRIAGYNERFTFTGKERDEETGYGYFGARYMDHVLMTMWLSVDPMADKYPSLSPYAYCAWNPIKLVDPNGEEISDHIDENGYLIAHYDDGDDGVYVHANGTTKTQIDNQREVLGNTGGIGLYIGDLGGEIDVSSVMENKLQESSTIAQTFRGNSKYSLYYDKVHTGGDWDLKNNEKTIWGVAWEYDNTNGTQTTFSCNRFFNASAADVGNYHAGYTGIMAGIGKYMLCKGAGLAETVKSFRNWRIFDGLYRANSLLTPLNLRSGDRKRDYIFNTMGMGDAKKELR